MNEYNSHDAKLVPGSKARAEDVNDRFDAVVVAFDRLPAPHPLERGFSDPVIVGDPTTGEHAVPVKKAIGGLLGFAVDTGVANAHVVNLDIAPVSYSEGMTISFKAKFASSGPSTINLNGLGIKQFVRSNGDAIATGDVLADQIITANYSNNRFCGGAALAGQFAETVASCQVIADAAEASAVTALTAPGTSGTSVTSLSVSIASKTFTTQTGKMFVPGMAVMIARTSAPAAAWMHGIVAEYTTGTGVMVVAVDLIFGSGTFTDWTISVSAPSSLFSPEFSGTPTAPTAAPGTNTTQIATTAFVAAAGVAKADISAVEAADALKADKAGTLGQFAATTSNQIRGVISDETGSGALVFADSPTLVNPALGVATGTSFNGITGLATVAPAMDGVAAEGIATTAAKGDHVHPSDTSRAAVESPAFAGVPTAPTAAAGTNTGQLATTAFVQNIKVSPALTGTPTAPTAAQGTNTTQLATTAFVTAADSLKANIASPGLTGIPTAPTAARGVSTEQIATTEFATRVLPIVANDGALGSGAYYGESKIAADTGNRHAWTAPGEWVDKNRNTVPVVSAAVPMANDIRGFEITKTGPNQLNILAGSCLDSTGTVPLETSASTPVTVPSTTNTPYYIFVVKLVADGSCAFRLYTTLAAVESDAGVSAWRKIDFCRTNGATYCSDFVTAGGWHYNILASESITQAGVTTTPTAMALSAQVPVDLVEMLLPGVAACSIDNQIHAFGLVATLTNSEIMSSVIGLVSMSLPWSYGTYGYHSNPPIPVPLGATVYCRAGSGTMSPAVRAIKLRR